MPSPVDDHIINEMVESALSTRHSVDLDKYLDNTFEWDYVTKTKTKTAKQYRKDKVKKEREKERLDVTKISVDLIDEIDKMKCKDAQKKHLKLKFKQHLLWFKEFGLKI